MGVGIDILYTDVFEYCTCTIIKCVQISLGVGSRTNVRGLDGGITVRGADTHGAGYGYSSSLVHDVVVKGPSAGSVHVSILVHVHVHVAATVVVVTVTVASWGRGRGRCRCIKVRGGWG